MVSNKMNVTRGRALIVHKLYKCFFLLGMEVVGKYDIWNFENPNWLMVEWIQCLDPTCAIVSYSSYGSGKQKKLSRIMALNRSYA